MATCSLVVTDVDIEDLPVSALEKLRKQEGDLGAVLSSMGFEIRMSSDPIPTEGTPVRELTSAQQFMLQLVLDMGMENALGWFPNIKEASDMSRNEEEDEDGESNYNI